MKTTHALFALFALGCAVTPRSNVCSDTNPCPSGQRCYEGFCLPDTRDAGMDARVGPACDEAEQCYEADGGRGMGVCQAGCRGDGGMCVDQVLPSPEVCNGLDDDCDGTPDEDFDFTTEAQCGTCGLECTANQTCCENTTTGQHECADLDSSIQHCQSCGRSCVSPNNACCGAGCVNTLTDNNNCGRCGNQCTGSSTCCNGTCVDVRFSDAHCGGCGNPCDTGAGEDCCGSVADPNAVDCRPSGDCATTCTPACTAGNDPLCCSGICVADISTDPQNCGGCGITCNPGQLCCNRQCKDPQDACGSCLMQCTTSQACCGAAGAQMCEDLGTDEHCRNCGEACTLQQDCCPGVGCVNLSTSPLHCGECGMGCESGTCCNGVCCAAGEGCCGGSCTPLNVNGNCGACGVNCVLGCNPDTRRCNVI